jgi:hypothetical protein
MTRPIAIDGEVAYVTLTRGCVAVIDAADVHLVEGWNWSATPSKGTFYAQRRTRVDGGRTIMMHRAILGLVDRATHVDHIDGNGLNNRRCNIRPCSIAQNQHNRGMSRTNTSGYKGVSWDAQGKKWGASIRAFGRQMNLGRFNTAEEAHAAYCAAAEKYHREFMRVDDGRRRTGGLDPAPAASLPGVQ